jgi:hypothetical protein
LTSNYKEIKSFEDWYNVTKQRVIEDGGKELLRCYGYSLQKGTESEVLTYLLYYSTYGGLQGVSLGC